MSLDHTKIKNLNKKLEPKNKPKLNNWNNPILDGSQLFPTIVTKKKLNYAWIFNIISSIVCWIDAWMHFVTTLGNSQKSSWQKMISCQMLEFSPLGPSSNPLFPPPLFAHDYAMW